MILEDSFWYNEYYTRTTYSTCPFQSNLKFELMIVLYITEDAREVMVVTSSNNKTHTTIYIYYIILLFVKGGERVV